MHILTVSISVVHVAGVVIAYIVTFQPTMWIWR